MKKNIIALFIVASIFLTASASMDCYPFALGEVCLNPIETQTPTATPTLEMTITPTAVSNIVIPLQIDFMRLPGIGVGCPNSSTTSSSLTSFTSSTYQFYANNYNRIKVKWAVFRVAWNPRSNNANPTGVNLIVFDNGPTNIQVIANFNHANTGNSQVFNDGVAITSDMQAIVTAKQFKNLGVQFYGNGADTCHVYSAWIEGSWELLP